MESSLVILNMCKYSIYLEIRIIWFTYHSQNIYVVYLVLSTKKVIPELSLVVIYILEMRKLDQAEV